MCTAHLDGYIYRHYADRLNQKYDEMERDYHIDSVAIAYRDSKSGISNNFNDTIGRVKIMSFKRLYLCPGQKNVSAACLQRAIDFIKDELSS